ncbi:hypothetical protein PUNSTDRAFT_69742, partial [Punctularia strigosozonata HHB-11173 SS5]|uniref:uncharacterized protein n=1 Tax=Punctularia strigosozonata (strain HHB-11173) TaxID=741275 RepID=UPI0004417974
STDKLDTKDGISLLSLKHHLMMSYLNSLVLLSSHRLLGHPLTQRSPPPAPFSSEQRSLRGGDEPGAGDLIDHMNEDRVILDKIKFLEGRMRYQIDKLVRLAQEAPMKNKDVVDDPLAFRPNPQNLLNVEASGSGSEDDDENEDDVSNQRTGIYRPPKLAPMPYTEAPRKKKTKEEREMERARPPNALSSLAYLDPSRPALESTSGLGGDVALQAHSARARNVRRLTEFEEENFTRLVMKKKDANRRLRDEEALAMGLNPGALDNRRGRRSGDGLVEEFSDVFKAVDRSSRTNRGRGGGDGYEELRERGKKKSVLERARSAGSRVDLDADTEQGADRKRKRSRFEMDIKSAKRRANSRARR